MLHPDLRSLLGRPQAFQANWFNKFNRNSANNIQTMENYFNSCSYGKAIFADVSVTVTQPRSFPSNLDEGFINSTQSPQPSTSIRAAL